MPPARYRDNEHAYEELVTELGSAYLCSLCRISNVTFNNHTSYIDGWLRLMKSDTHILLKVSTDAGKAIRMLTNNNETG